MSQAEVFLASFTRSEQYFQSAVLSLFPPLSIRPWTPWPRMTAVEASRRFQS